MTIYLLRHGETVWNRDKRLQGQKDTPLTQKGIIQAEAMGIALKDQLFGRKPEVFLSSPLRRAHQTAVIVADILNFGTEGITIEDRLKEVTFGVWDGLNMEEILESYETLWQQRRQSQWLFSPPEGESYVAAGARIQPLIDNLSSSKILVIVAHGSLNRIFRGLWGKLEPEVFLTLNEPQDGFYRLETDGTETFIQA